jgi:hypothetical protein
MRAVAILSAGCIKEAPLPALHHTVRFIGPFTGKMEWKTIIQDSWSFTADYLY